MQVLSSDSALVDAVQGVLEQMCFVSLIAEPEVCPGSDAGGLRLLSAWQNGPEQPLGKQVAFSGPFCGNVHFWFARDLAYTLAANLLGSEVAAMQEHAVSDALGEISNMVCGSMLGTLEGRQSFALQTPVDAGDPAPGKSFTCLFHTEEGLLLSSLSLGDAGQ